MHANRLMPNRLASPTSPILFCPVGSVWAKGTLAVKERYRYCGEARIFAHLMHVLQQRIRVYLIKLE